MILLLVHAMEVVMWIEISKIVSQNKLSFVLNAFKYFGTAMES